MVPCYGTLLTSVDRIKLTFRNPTHLFTRTMFLMGPLKQLKSMFAKTRVIATILLLICIVLTLVMAFVVRTQTSLSHLDLISLFPLSPCRPHALSPCSPHCDSRSPLFSLLSSIRFKSPASSSSSSCFNISPSPGTPSPTSLSLARSSRSASLEFSKQSCEVKLLLLPVPCLDSPRFVTLWGITGQVLMRSWL